MMKRIGRDLRCDKSPLLEGLSTKGTHSHTQSYNMSTSSKFIISKDVVKYTKLQNYGGVMISFFTRIFYLQQQQQKIHYGQK